MTMRRGLAKSKNMISIRILQSVGARNAQDWIGRFGFDEEKHPPYLTMALGAGSVTPMQLVSGYSVFANGGYRVQPHLITRIVDYKNRALVESPAPAQPDEAQRAIPARNAFVMGSMLQEDTRTGTAARAQATLKRPDIYGKTGTTNDAMDAWFAGYQPNLAAVVWIGYDTPRKLGDRETGGGLSLPVWINFMESALRAIPVSQPAVPDGLVNVGGDWLFEELSRNGSVTTLGVSSESTAAKPAPLPAGEERNRILDLFRN
jgi:penicillin-binding protein 1A